MEEKSMQEAVPAFNPPEGNESKDEQNSKVGTAIVSVVKNLREQIEVIYGGTGAPLPYSIRNPLDRLRKGAAQVANNEKGNREDKYVCKVVRLPMDAWLKKGWKEKDPPVHAIQAFYRAVPDHTHMQVNEDRGVQSAATIRPASERPLRVVVNSKLLIQGIEEITGIGIDEHPLVVNSPYKLFMHALPLIEPYLAKLKAKHSELGNIMDSQISKWKSRAENTSEPKANQPDGAEDNNTTTTDSLASDIETLGNKIDHFELLLNFIQTDLQHLIELRKHVADLTLESITFEDLWHLFSVGDTIFTNEGRHEQLYVTYMIAGGKQRLRNRTLGELENIRRRELGRILNRRTNWHDANNDDSDEYDEERLRIKTSGKGTWAPLTIDCYRMACDGNYIGPIDEVKKIPPFIGKKRITELPVYPLAFHPEAKEVKKRLEERGKSFLRCSGHRSYFGIAYDHRHEHIKEELHGDVYIDFEEYYRSERRVERPRLGKLRMSETSRPEVSELDHTVGLDDNKLIELVDYQIDQLRAETFLAETTPNKELLTTPEALNTPDIIYLFPHWVVAFAFRTRAWVHLDLDCISEMDKSDEARRTGFNELVIPQKYRKLLVSLVESHASGHRKKMDHKNTATSEEPIRQIDLVRGKGLGLIILLHGPPGSGKTSTAETIAAYTGRPLYALTCGDLGLRIDHIEAQLELHTRRADKWGCVLLLDEADVFLVKRGWKEMGRNALVAVFLRQLEYYAGILFLTTNRVGILDEAFTSRIHVALRYPKIERKQTLKIWKNILDRLARDNANREIKIDFDREDILDYAESQFEKCKENESTWNGRQIRNAFQTAIALGQYERSMRLQEKGLTSEEALRTGKKKWRRLKLSTEYFEVIADTAQEFEDYLYAVHGERELDRALEENIRNDYFNDRNVTVRVHREEPPPPRVPATDGRGPVSSGVSSSRRSGPSARPAANNPSSIGGSKLHTNRPPSISVSSGPASPAESGDENGAAVNHGHAKKRPQKKARSSSESESD